MSSPDNHAPPQWPLRFFRWYCHPDYVEDIEGDLLERFERRLKKEGSKKARWGFTKDVVKLFRPGLIRSFKTTIPLNYQSMLRHNFLLTFRTFKRYKASFFINLVGLSSGLACALLIFLWVNDELRIDKFSQKDSQQHYQIMTNRTTSNGIQTTEYTPSLLAEALEEEMPEVEQAISIVPPLFYYLGILSVGEKAVRTTPQFVSEGYFDLFPIHFKQGDKNALLSNRKAVSLSEDIALTLFNTTDDILGKTVEFKNSYYNGLYTVSGIFSLPENTSSRFDVLFNYDLFLDRQPELREWYNTEPSTHVVLQEGTDIDQFSSKVKELFDTKLGRNTTTTYLTQLYADKYLNSRYENGLPSGGRIEYVRLFSIIAAFILLIACINFMNLSTAKASRRVKEIGVKKAMGVGRKTLIIQYLSESIVLSFLSLLVALTLVTVFLPQFNTITGKQLTLNLDPTIVIYLLCLILLTGILAGSYPALYLSGFNPAVVLKGKFASTLGEQWTRKGLVVFQFSLSVMLIVSVLVVYQQIQFIQTKNLGYDRDHVISIPREGSVNERFNSFQSEIEKIAGVVGASAISGDLTGNVSSSNRFGWEGQTPEEKSTRFNFLDVDYGLIELLRLNLVAGRSFSREFSTDSSAIVFNETAIEVMGLDDPIGKTVNFFGERKIVGVVEDFQFESLHKKVEPLFFKIGDSWEEGNVLIRLEAGTERATLDQLQQFYQAFNPGFLFDYTFLDEDYQALYAAEQRVSTLSKYFASIAILISCLGLFGLAAYTAERRLKEIGIRKILGANSFSIIRLLSGDFTKMVLLAIVIGLPVSYWVAQWWLEGFAYRIDLAWWYFIGAGLIALLIAWLTVGLQTIKASRVNLVACLKDE
ncbi:MAG: ABC transporter permease [Bacteroidota bacterium]